MKENLKQIERLLEIMEELREKCPWDRKQTMLTLRNNTIEETFELIDAIVDGDMDGIKKELGDLLLHIVFYSKIASESGAFDIGDVAEAISEKLIFRHPHVFGEVTVSGAENVSQNWEALKQKEKGGNKTILSGVPKSLPSLTKAYRIGEKAAHVGFDWEKREDVWGKVREELGEFEAEILTGNKENMEKEFGDLMFSLVNAARLYNIDPDLALERTNLKFIKRFTYLEEQTIKKGRSLHDMTLAEMDEYWEEAKKCKNTCEDK